MTAWAETVVREGGYLILAALIALENLFPPIPSELLLPLAGSRVAMGDMAFVPAVLAATAGRCSAPCCFTPSGATAAGRCCCAGAACCGSPSGASTRPTAGSTRYGGRIVFFGRLVPGVRSVVSVPAGLSEMPFGRFLLLTARSARRSGTSR